MRAAYGATALPCIVFSLLLAAGVARGQVIPEAVILGGEFGTGLYLGEFNSLQYEGGLGPYFGSDFGFNLRYNIAQSFSLLVEYGHMSLGYDVTGRNRQRYASRFFGPAGSTTYPGSDVRITSQNHIDINRYIIFARSHFLPESRFVPFFTLGLGLIDFEVTNDSDEVLPINLTGDYEKMVMVMPVGGGAEYHFSDRVALYGEGLFYVNSTDYLDGYAHFLDFESGEVADPTGPGIVETPPDYFVTFNLGVAVTLYKPESYRPPPPPESAERPMDPPLRPMESGELPVDPPAEQPPTEPPAENPPPFEPRTPQEDTTSFPEESTPLDTATADTAQAEPPRTTPSEDLPAPWGSPADSDGDGLLDREEMFRYMTDPLNADSDGDNLSDSEEIQKLNTSPNNRDTDSDGLKDGEEHVVYNTNPLASDSDRDGLKDGQEIRLYRSDPLDTDTDDDRVRDGVEVTRIFTNPNNPDTDKDGVMDGDDECPHIAGDIRNNGCPTGMDSTDYSERIRESGPLKGLPEVPMEGDRTDFAGIYFKVNSDDFDLSRPETQQNLARLLNYMKQCEEIGVMIEGHTSAEGNPRWNQQLSEMRARRVREWLLANGVEREKILGTTGYGSQMPKIPEPRPGNVPPSLLERIRKQNRRITTLVKETCR